MADPERDAPVSEGYRALGREESPPAPETPEQWLKRIARLCEAGKARSR